ncbi:methyltransferase family protein [Hugenholtzia roseola]|uniref:methyltransferase family protein n=1 Tax=Hugenholtzia roseola TaxID=1002 RepID=UPI000478959B|nr:isoprenylcysteine carboxylmethyltransferase family protein [Hugenholtzia roseola]
MALQEEMETQGNFLFRYRSHLPLLIMVVGIIVFIYEKVYQRTYASTDPFSILPPDSIPYLSLFVSLLGLGIRIYTVGHTPKNTSGRNTAEGQVAEQLNSTGIYSMVRHPLYLGNFFMWLGAAILVANFWFVVSFVFVYWVYYERIMFAEEQFLRRKFGTSYTDWAAQTPAFVPQFGNFKKAKYPFSIKKVLKKEKNGIWAIFIIIAFFEYLARYLESRTLSLQYDVWTYALIGSTIFYFVFKFLKKYTQVLNEDGR